MFARMHTLATTPEQHDQGVEIVQEQLLPWLRDSTGFRGLIRLADRAGGKTLVITLWADEDALAASSEIGQKLSDLATLTTGATRLALEEYDVTFFDVET
jgi:heme-degrading monooxygenase HmoA